MMLLNRLCRNPVTLHSFGKAMRVTPLSPPEEEAAQGAHPLDHISTSLPFQKKISCEPQKGHRIFYGSLIGGGGKGCLSPKERQNNFPMISTKLKNSFIILYFSMLTTMKIQGPPWCLLLVRWAKKYQPL